MTISNVSLPYTLAAGAIENVAHVQANDEALRDKINEINAVQDNSFGHTFAVTGEIKVPSGATDYIPPYHIPVKSGWTVELVSCKYIIQSGTSATVKLQKNGSDATGFTAISVTTTAAVTDPANVAVADMDKIALVVTAVVGTPTHLSFTCVFEATP